MKKEMTQTEQEEFDKKYYLTRDIAAAGAAAHLLKKLDGKNWIRDSFRGAWYVFDRDTWKPATNADVKRAVKEKGAGKYHV